MSREVCGICWCPYDEYTGECACEPEPKKQHMTTLRTAAQQALEALESLFNWQVDPVRGQRCSDAITALRAALEQPKFTLSCGCPSQYGGVPAYWDRDGSTAFGMICEKHWHEYGARNEA